MYEYNSYYDAKELAVLGGLASALSLIGLVLVIFSIVAMWKIFKKAGKNGWEAIIPFYNSYVLFEITWGNGWYFLLMFTAIVPVIGWIACLVILIITMVKLAKAFGKDGGFAAGLIFLSIIFIGILAFDKSTYLGAPTTGNNMTPAGPPSPQDNFQNAGPIQTPQPDITGSPVAEPIVNNGMDIQEPNPEPVSTPTENTSFCANCGTPLPEGTMFCPNCGSPKAS